MEPIHPDVFPIVSWPSNCYLVRSRDGALLVDTGLKGSLKRDSKSAGSRGGISLAGLRLILITHADGDHYGGLAALKALAPNAIACASQPEADAMAEGRMSRELKTKGFRKFLYDLVAPLFKSPPVKVDRVIKPGDSFDWLGGLVALDSKGHTPGHLSFYSESTGILFAGDSILVHGERAGPGAWRQLLG